MGKENERKVIKSSSVVITTIMHATSLIKYFKVSPFSKLHGISSDLPFIEKYA